MEVKWDENMCQHAGVCVKQLPQVFKIVDGKFVIDVSGADESSIRETVKACPSGALSCS